MRKFDTTMIVAAALACVVMLAPIQVHAASNSLGVNPRRDYTVKPGEKVQDTLNVTNLHRTEELIITIRPVDFKAANQTGAPNLLLKQDEPTRWSLKPYLTIPSTYKIPAGQSADVPFTVSIPANVGAGSYYSAIHYSVSGGEEAQGENNLSLSGSSVSLLFVRVPGEANSSLVLNDFGAFTPSQDMSDGTFASFYSAAQPKYVSYSLENKGNIAEEPTGSVQLKNIFGQQVKLYEKANPHGNLVLIEQTRRIDLCLNEVEVTEKNKLNGQDEQVNQCHDPKLAPGRYTANMTLLYGNEGLPSNEIKAVTTFWYLPAWFIVAVLVVLAAVVYFVRKLILKLRNHGKPTYGSRKR